MIRKVFFVVILAIVSAVSLFAGPKHYSDLENGYSGYSDATYMGISDKVNPEGIAMIKQDMNRKFKFCNDCGKLNKEEKYLLWSALKEFDLSDNEIYAVSIISDSSPEIALSLIVIIKGNGKDLAWYNIGYFFLNHNDF